MMVYAEQVTGGNPEEPPGILRMIDLSNADYHAHPAVSKSHLDQVARSPLHYWCRYLDPDRVPPTPTPALVLGSAVHTAVLEPHLWQAEYAVAPEGIERRTKAGKDAWAEFEASSQGKTLLRAEDAAQTLRMADAVHSHPAARLILEQEGLAEASYFWTDEATGEECKCRPDWHSADRRLIVDLKTTEDASPETFQRSVHKWRYHVQTAWYLRGLGADQFVFIAVEKQEPHLVAVYVATPDMVAAGGRVADRDLALLSECRKLNEWPGYSDEIIPIDLPRYAND